MLIWTQKRLFLKIISFSCLFHLFFIFLFCFIRKHESPLILNIGLSNALRNKSGISGGFLLQLKSFSPKGTGGSKLTNNLTKISNITKAKNSDQVTPKSSAPVQKISKKELDYTPIDKAQFFKVNSAIEKQEKIVTKAEEITTAPAPVQAEESKIKESVVPVALEHKELQAPNVLRNKKDKKTKKLELQKPESDNNQIIELEVSTKGAIAPNALNNTENNSLGQIDDGINFVVDDATELSDIIENNWYKINGMPDDFYCEVLFDVGYDGKVDKFKILDSHKSRIYQAHVKETLSKIIFSKKYYGKKIQVTFKV